LILFSVLAGVWLWERCCWAWQQRQVAALTLTGLAQAWHRLVKARRAENVIDGGGAVS